MISNSPQAKSQYNPHYLYNIILFFPDLCRSLLRQFVFLRAPREKAIMVVRAEPLKIAKKLPLSFCLMLVNILLREKHRTPPLSLRICKISRSVFALRSFFCSPDLAFPKWHRCATLYFNLAPKRAIHRTAFLAKGLQTDDPSGYRIS